MPTVTRTTADAEGRVTLPKGFVNAALVIEEVSDTELRIRHAAPQGGEVVFAEEAPPRPLSDVERDRFLDLLENPPPPTQAFVDAVARHKGRRGQ